MGRFDVATFRYVGEILAPVPGRVRAVAPVGDRFAVATGTGEVGLLGWNESHTRLRWLEHFNPLTDLPEEFLPSALAVLEGAGLEILVTSEGLDRIFVFVPGVNPDEPNTPGKPPTTTTTPLLPEAPLALVPTLTAVTLAEEEGEPAHLPSDSVESEMPAIAAAGGGDELVDDTGLSTDEAESKLFDLLGEVPPIPLLEEILRNLELEPLHPKIELNLIDAPFQQDFSRHLQEVPLVPLPPPEVVPLDVLFQKDLSWLARLTSVTRISGENLEEAFTDLQVVEVGGLPAWKMPWSTIPWSTSTALGIVLLVAGAIYGWGIRGAEGDRPDERETSAQIP